MPPSGSRRSRGEEDTEVGIRVYRATNQKNRHFLAQNPTTYYFEGSFEEQQGSFVEETERDTRVEEEREGGGRCNQRTGKTRKEGGIAGSWM